MSNVEQKRRELFEGWVLGEAEQRTYSHMSCVLIRDSFGGYATTWVDCAWLGFNAALNAVEVVLPQEEHYWPHDYCGAVEDCRDAIEKTGLGIKVK